VELDAGIAQAHNNLGSLLAELGDDDGAVAALRQALALAPDRPSTWSNLLLALSYSERLPAAAIAAEHRAYGRHFEARIRPLTPVALRPLPGRRLKVGYVSSDFSRPRGGRIYGVSAGTSRSAAVRNLRFLQFHGRRRGHRVHP